MIFRNLARRLAAPAAIALIVFAALAWPATGRAADPADQTAAAQRAWLSFPVVAIDPAAVKPGQPITYSLAMRNNGRAPASDVTLFVDNGFIEFPQGGDLGTLLFNVADMCRDLSVQKTGEVVPPAAAAGDAPDGVLKPPYKTVLSTDVRPDSVVDEEMLAGTSTFFVRGCALYKTADVVGTTRFCRLIDLAKDASGHVTAVTSRDCPQGNRAE